MVCLFLLSGCTLPVASNSWQICFIWNTYRFHVSAFNWYKKGKTGYLTLSLFGLYVVRAWIKLSTVQWWKESLREKILSWPIGSAFLPDAGWFWSYARQRMRWPGTPWRGQHAAVRHRIIWLLTLEAVRVPIKLEFQNKSTRDELDAEKVGHCTPPWGQPPPPPPPQCLIRLYGFWSSKRFECLLRSKKSSTRAFLIRSLRKRHPSISYVSPIKLTPRTTYSDHNEGNSMENRFISFQANLTWLNIDRFTWNLVWSSSEKHKDSISATFIWIR